jgi:hypothetical protein
MTTQSGRAREPEVAAPTPFTALVGLVLGAGFAVLGLLPHLLDGGRVVGAGPWASANDGDVVPFALVPLDVHHLTAPFYFLVTGAALAGMFARFLKARRSRERRERRGGRGPGFGSGSASGSLFESSTGYQATSGFGLAGYSTQGVSTPNARVNRTGVAANQSPSLRVSASTTESDLFAPRTAGPPIPVWAVALGLVVTQIVAVIQSALALRRFTHDRSELLPYGYPTDTVVVIILVFVLAIAIMVFTWLISTEAATFSFGMAVASVPIASWLVLLVVPDTPSDELVRTLNTLAHWLPAVLVGVALAMSGRLVDRAGAALVSGITMVVTPAVVAAVQLFFSTGSSTLGPAERFQLMWDAARTTGTDMLAPAAVAIVISVVGSVFTSAYVSGRSGSSGS